MRGQLLSLLDQSNCFFFASFEAGVYQGITRTRDFCESCTTLIVPGMFVGSVRHSYPYPNCLLTLCLWGTHKTIPGVCIYPRYYPTNNCNFCRTHTRTRNFWKFCTPVPHSPGVRVQHVYTCPELLEVLYARATIPGSLEVQ